MTSNSLKGRLARSLPFYYGWVIVADTVLVSFSTRTVMAVALLSVFVIPMTEELGWSRGLFSGAVSLGGLCAVLVSPFLGRWLDRYGAGTLISVSSLLTAILAVGLSLVSHPLIFYALYVPGRLIFAGPLELGLPTAISNWFIRRRPLGLAVDSIAKGAGLAVIPLVAQAIISAWDWRTAWIFLGVLTFILGVIPSLLLVSRRPEDMGLEPDPWPQSKTNEEVSDPGKDSSSETGSISEVNFTVQQALRTRAFWVLAVFSGAGLMVQAGISLHQVSHYIDQGITAQVAAFAATTFACSQIVAGLFWSIVARKIPIRYLMSASAFVVALGAISTSFSQSMVSGIPAAAAVGFGVGGLHLLIRLAWADYYGREHLGSIRGLTMSAQVGGQALGPIIAGVLFDLTGGYRLPFTIFTISALLAGILVLTATPPKQPAPQPEMSRL
ncbi:MAG: MFS transporter [Chloroflexi bacterium]|nr:MFS transporter [Chloroflexota bacterium]MDA1220294.1 MFS transporter [Chloroflexota bacterium]